MRRLLRCVAAVGLVSLFSAAVLGMSWAIFDGPDGVRKWALILAFVLAGLVVMWRWTVLMVEAGAHPLGMILAGLAALFFAGTVPAWFATSLLDERERLTTCRVLTVTEEEGFNGATVHLHRLACDGIGSSSIMWSGRALRVDRQVRVRYDPEGRSDEVRLAGDEAAMEPRDIGLIAGAELGLILLGSLVLVAIGRPPSSPAVPVRDRAPEDELDEV
ncbi:hypothetical protein [Spirillospora sp. NPDC029432]|uniref:hypothetical protein n=1 Tax=Spirillospora sp. NPDC029432 TaxID=3154599 RepID=UPI0034560CFC